jgi:hypothetical protein
VRNKISLVIPSLVKERSDWLRLSDFGQLTSLRRSLSGGLRHVPQSELGTAHKAIAVWGEEIEVRGARCCHIIMSWWCRKSNQVAMLTYCVFWWKLSWRKSGDVTCAVPKFGWRSISGGGGASSSVIRMPGPLAKPACHVRRLSLPPVDFLPFGM